MSRRMAGCGVTLLVVMASFCIKATAEDPEQIGIPYLVDAETGKLIPLERQRTNAGMHIKALGFGGASSVVRFNGKTSPVHVPSRNIRFAIRFASMPPTPSSFINLDVLVRKKDSRESIVGKAGPMGLGARSTMGDSEIELKFLPGHDSVLYFEPSAPLKPGEYVVTTKEGPYGFLFAVD